LSFCGQHCVHAFEVIPSEYLGEHSTPVEARVAGAHVHH